MLMERLERISRRFSPQAPARRCANGSALIEVLEELGEAARAHFHRTTALMSAIDYDGVHRHHTESALLMAEYTELLRAWREEGQQVLDETMRQIIRQWLLAHILGVDRDFVSAYQQVCHQDVLGAGASQRA